MDGSGWVGLVGVYVWVVVDCMCLYAHKEGSISHYQPGPLPAKDGPNAMVPTSSSIGSGSGAEGGAASGPWSQLCDCVCVDSSVVVGGLVGQSIGLGHR